MSTTPRYIVLSPNPWVGSGRQTLILFVPRWVRWALALGTPAKLHRIITGEPCVIWRDEWPPTPEGET